MTRGEDRRSTGDAEKQESRAWTSRAAQEVTERLARAWGSVKHRGGGNDGGAGIAFDPNDADPTELFSKERERELRALGRANILVVGQTGVGKSTLINAVFRKPLAEADTGKPVTKVIQRFEDPDVPVTLYDTKGVELGDSKGRIIKDFKRLIEKSRKAPAEQHIHALWYCMDAGQTRVQSWDIEIIRELAGEVPVVLIFTQTIDDERADALENAILEERLPIVEGRAVRTLARPRTIAGNTLKVSGLEDLVRLTNELLPEAVSRAFANAQGVVIDLKVDQCRVVVLGAAGAAAAAAATPFVPVDAVVLKPIQIGMLGSITAVFGVDLAPKDVAGLVLAVVGKGGIESAGKTLVKQLAKHVPGGGVLNATVAAAVTGALGEAYIRLCVEWLRREAAGKPMPSAEMVSFLLDAYGGLLRKPSDSGDQRSKSDDEGSSAADAA